MKIDFFKNYFCFYETFHLHGSNQIGPEKIHACAYCAEFDIRISPE